TRYSLLETVRQYARERLAADAEAAVYRARHRDFFLATAQEAAPHLAGPQQGAWLEQLESEYDNLRQALTFCLEDPEEFDQGINLAVCLGRFWHLCGYWSEGLEHLLAMLADSRSLEYPESLADLLKWTGTLEAMQSKYDAARSHFETAIVTYSRLGDRAGAAF